MDIASKFFFHKVLINYLSKKYEVCIINFTVGNVAGITLPKDKIIISNRTNQHSAPPEGMHWEKRNTSVVLLPKRHKSWGDIGQLSTEGESTKYLYSSKLSRPQKTRKNWRTISDWRRLEKCDKCTHDLVLDSHL